MFVVVIIFFVVLVPLGLYLGFANLDAERVERPAGEQATEHKRRDNVEANWEVIVGLYPRDDDRHSPEEEYADGEHGLELYSSFQLYTSSLGITGPVAGTGVQRGT